MQGKNVIIAILIIALFAIGLLLWKNNENNDQLDSNTAAENQLPQAQVDTNSPNQEKPVTEEPNVEEPEFSESFADNNWLLESAIVAEKTIDLDINVPAPLTLNFEKAKKSYSGFSGCNNFSGTYTAASPNAFSFGATVSTKKGCMDTMNLETAVFKGMAEIEKFEIVNGKLVLTSKDGETKLTYKQAI